MELIWASRCSQFRSALRCLRLRTPHLENCHRNTICKCIRALSCPLLRKVRHNPSSLSTRLLLRSSADKVQRVTSQWKSAQAEISRHIHLLSKAKRRHKWLTDLRILAHCNKNTNSKIFSVRAHVRWLNSSLASTSQLPACVTTNQSFKLEQTVACRAHPARSKSTASAAGLTISTARGLCSHRQFS